MCCSPCWPVGPLVGSIANSKQAGRQVAVMPSAEWQVAVEDHKRFPLMVETPFECRKRQSKDRVSSSNNSRNSRCSWEPEGIQIKKTTQWIEPKPVCQFCFADVFWRYLLLLFCCFSSSFSVPSLLLSFTANLSVSQSTALRLIVNFPYFNLNTAETANAVYLTSSASV